MMMMNASHAAHKIKKMSKEHSIVMLPSEGPSMILFDTVGNELVYNPPVPQEKTVNVKPQHLYILSDEKIKKEDNILVDIYPHGNPEWKLAKVVSVYESIVEVDLGWSTTQTKPVSVCKKIIATTDSELLTCKGVKREGESCSYNNNCKYPSCKLPQIPQHIIEAYVKKPLDEVEVEYLTKLKKGTDLGYECNYIVPDKPKLNQDGTLAVSLVEHSDLNTYLRSRERILSSQANDSESPIQHQLEARNKLAEVRQTLKWIKENL